MSTDTQLRVMTAGSVDDGKSTLIGRLLYESKAILSDQLNALSRSRFSRTEDGSVDLSLLTDGLEAEREQGITIDVAYRYFNTGRRKFILADAPGHEQYTRNMVTGASTADALIVLIDATRVKDGVLLPQTKRHSAIAKLLDVGHVIFAVNKMDLLDYDESAFRVIERACQALSHSLGLANTPIIPISALRGDNVTAASQTMPWYTGQPLLQLLENVPVAAQAAQAPLRFPVQWIIRANGSQTDAFRGVAGRIESGRVALGDALCVTERANAPARVAQILIGEKNIESAVAGQSVTLVFDHEIDVSRGDWLVHTQAAIAASNEFTADLCWLDAQPLQSNRSYLLKHGTTTTRALVTAVERVLDVSTLEHTTTESTTLAMNAIARVRLRAQRALPVESFAENKATGAFVLIDVASHQTAAAGMVVA